ncbi:MAG: hypothetical protein ACLFR8_03195 [Alkalispirochaeta sp.]
MTAPEYIHFFSWATRISIELPVGFEEQFEDADTNSAVYADDLDASDTTDDADGTGDPDTPGARVMTKMTAVHTDSAEAYRSLADASAGIGSRTVTSRDELCIDGAPAIRQTLTYRDDDLEIDVFRHETFCQMANIVFSITCLAPASRSPAYRSSFDHAADTARFILLPEQSATFAHEGVGISAWIPDSWSATELSDRHVRLFGPPHSGYDDYRPTFSIQHGEPEGFGEEWFRDFADASRRTLADHRSEFELRSVKRFTLSSFVDVDATWYTHTSEAGVAVAQLQALCLVDRYRMYLINAATLLPLAEEHFPVFDGILRSLRMLPER